MLLGVFAMLFLVSCSSSSENIEQFNVKVARVIDGDTFVDTNNNHYRLLGIDAPEMGRFSKKSYQKTSGMEYFYANKAKQYLADLIEQKVVQIKIIKNDKYNRKVANIWINFNNISIKLVENGFARVYYISKNKKDYFYYWDSTFIDKLYKSQQKAIINQSNIWKENINSIYPKYT